MRMCIFQFTIDPKISHKRLEKCYPKDKFDKSTRRICSMYFSTAAFIDNMKFPLSYQNINNLMLINFYISLITKRFFKNETPNINKIRNKILDCFQKVSRRWLLNFSSYCDARFESNYFFKEKPSSQLIPVLLLQRIAELSPTSYILYTLICTKSAAAGTIGNQILAGDTVCFFTRRIELPPCKR